MTPRAILLRELLLERFGPIAALERERRRPTQKARPVRD